jgi:dimethylamine--corrinoid protein Co-methyltransferase
MGNDKLFTRMGDGSAEWMTREEMLEDVLAGTEDAAKRGKSDPLPQEDIDDLMEILTMPAKNVSVERGHEGVTTFDAGTLKIPIRSGVPVDRTTDVLIHERVLCSDSMELCNTDYSYKSVKNIAPEEAMIMEQAQQNCIIPLFYGAMPNMGLYTKPDGPEENWAMLLPEGRVQEAMDAQARAAEYCADDMIYIGSMLAEAGADGIQFDTAGASGDADMYASLKAAKALADRYPDLCVTMGMANEFTLGMHGRLDFEGDRLAGQYPAAQVKTVEKSGARSYGCVVNTNSSRSFPWNLSRAVTFVRQAVEAADIPVLVDVGMGVGGIPLTNCSPTDATTRVSKTMLEIGKADGL